MQFRFRSFQANLHAVKPLVKKFAHQAITYRVSKKSYSRLQVIMRKLILRPIDIDKLGKENSDHRDNFCTQNKKHDVPLFKHKPVIKLYQQHKRNKEQIVQSVLIIVSNLLTYGYCASIFVEGI